MTDDDEVLRARLARLDPTRSGGAGPAESPTAQQIRERVMQTIEENTQDVVASGPSWRRSATIAGVAAAVVLIAAGATVLTRDTSPKTPPVAAAPTTMTLSAPEGADPNNPTMASCIMFDVEFLKQMPVAFGGTVIDVTPTKVTLDVDRWYKGGTEDQVSVATMEGQTVALDGVEFVKGERYLVTATEGVVNVCGFSGPATPDFEKAFDEAFPS